MIKFRKAIIADLEALFDIRNEPTTYQYSLTPREVSKDEHSKWFRFFVLKNDANLVCLVDGQVAGICYFSTKEDTCTISIYLSSDYLGRGIGKKLLSKTLQKAKNAGYCKFSAHIHKENIASVKIFEANGFTKIVNQNDETTFLIYTLIFPNENL